ncbi:MAG TPA: ATP-binding protein [Leptospiraceae bacterium]|nr:ATP-binding protein [Leptospiraceae bacterium]HMW07579.1 ATP-binding protein [Leptospiraceae bacterium]HMX33043.1 ATP-binding protein [Leptospiraceae bacterium]HMY33206.1 ATP-binding protein [Leptospiraceae bacterium]HMZ65076.1 ATP-binding protein [Leptospiraceae bacterium]
MREINFQFPNQLSILSNVRTKINDFIGSDLDNILKNRIILSIDEAISNIIEHGFPEVKDSLISVYARLEKDKITFVLEDEGIPFNPLTKPPVDVDEHLELGEDGGMGIHIVQKIMNVEYERVHLKNRLTLTKNFTEETEFEKS